MDYSFLGSPFVEVPTKDSILLQTMDYSFFGEPFVRRNDVDNSGDYFLFFG